LKWEDSERFKSVIARLEGWNVPMVSFGRENRIKGYLVLKVDEVREFLRYSVADLIYDAFISKERLRGLEDLGWEVEVCKPTPELLALWKVGLDMKVNRSRVSEAKEKFRALLDYLREGRNEENR
jgi:hypothetical protein